MLLSGSELMKKTHFQLRTGFLENDDWQGHLRVLRVSFNSLAEEQSRIRKVYDEAPQRFGDAFQELIATIRQDNEGGA